MEYYEVPGIAAWMEQEQVTQEMIETCSMSRELRLLTQEETNYSRLREYAETGIFPITLTLKDGRQLFRTMTRDELMS